MKSQKIRVAVLMGGDSSEKEISLESGRNITYKLSPQKYTILPIFVSQNMELFKINQSLLVRNSTKEIEPACNQENKINWNDLPSIADFVFIALHGGKGENGCVQGMLEMLGLPYNGSSVLTSSLCIDKFKTAQFLKSNGFETPNGLVITQQSWHTQEHQIIENIKKTIGFPAIVKPHDDGCSMMVYKILNSQQLTQAINDLFINGKQTALVEEYIVGMELTVGVIGNDNPRALPPSQTIAQGGILSIKEKFLPGAGENQTPAPLPKNTLALIQKTIEDAYGAVNCTGYARIDCFYQSATQSKTKKERVIILEINTLPGMTPATCIFHQAAEINIKPMDFIDQIINLGFEAHNKNIIKTVQNNIEKTN